ncbi:MAG TPA: hypothetical protein VFH76_25815 [Kribbella sp.]|nr:hypothetical protein [Kribbella sp.]
MGAPRSIATAVRRSLEVARSGPGWSPAHDLTAVLAVKLAKQLTAAESTSDVVRLTRELRALMSTLPDALPAPMPADADESEGGEADDIDAELAEIVGSGPEVGNPAH